MRGPVSHAARSSSCSEQKAHTHGCVLEEGVPMWCMCACVSVIGGVWVQRGSGGREPSEAEQAEAAVWSTRRGGRASRSSVIVAVRGFIYFCQAVVIEWYALQRFIFCWAHSIRPSCLPDRRTRALPLGHDTSHKTNTVTSCKMQNHGAKRRRLEGARRHRRAPADKIRSREHATPFRRDPSRAHRIRGTAARETPSTHHHAFHAFPALTHT